MAVSKINRASGLGNTQYHIEIMITIKIYNKRKQSKLYDLRDIQNGMEKQKRQFLASLRRGVGFQKAEMRGNSGWRNLYG